MPLSWLLTTYSSSRRGSSSRAGLCVSQQGRVACAGANNVRGLRLAGGSCSSDHVTRPFRPVHAQSSARRSSRSAELAPGHLVLLDQCRQVISHCPVLLPQSCILCVHPRHVLSHCLQLRHSLLPRLLLLLQAGVRRRQARLTGRQRPAHTQTDRLGNQPADAGVPLCTAVQQYSIAPRACAKEPKIFSTAGEPAHLSVSPARWRSAASAPACAAASSARRSSSACSESRSASSAPTMPRSSASSPSRRCRGRRSGSESRLREGFFAVCALLWVHATLAVVHAACRRLADLGCCMLGRAPPWRGTHPPEPPLPA